MEFTGSGATNLQEEKDVDIAIEKAETRALKTAIEITIGYTIDKIIQEYVQG
jgi:hypothetical protein